ncbi:MAG: hypothetical protein QF660_02385 [Anaerolineales bacterium]|nr:hypothetical protein [Anaerolineales bacterium]
MEILVCVKRIPVPGARFMLTEDGREIVTRNLGFTISPHEECAVEAAVQMVEQRGGRSTVLTMGEEVAGDQLRFAISMGVNEAILIESDGERDATAIAEAIVDTIRAEQAAGVQFDVLLFGNESADAGNYQVGVRVAYGLNLPCVTGVKALDIQANGTAVAKREIAEGWEVYELALPAVFTVKEGINLPRYPLLRGRLAAKRKEIKTYPALDSGEAGLEMVVFKTPPEVASQVQVVGKGPGAAQKVAKLMQEIGVL